MSDPKMLKQEVTSRRRLRDSHMSTNQRMGRSGLSPRSCSETTPRSSPKYERARSGVRDSEEVSDDEIDHCTTNYRHDSPLRQSPGLYPRLDPQDENWSPTSSPRSWSGQGSPNESYGSSRSHCSPECASPPGKHGRKEPVTPIKGSPGKKISTDVHEDIPTHTHRGATPILYIFIALVGIICVLILHTILKVDESTTAPASQTKTIQEVHEDFLDKLRKLNRELSQPRESWVQLIGQVGSVMKNAPQQPAVLLVVMPQDSKGTAVCLVHKIAEAIRDAFEDPQFIMYDVHTSRKTEYPGALKLELDESLQNLNESHAAVVHHIEEIPGQAAMIFHAYCDNENAPFKQAVILPVMEVPAHYSTVADYSSLDEFVSSRLTKVWGVQLAEKDVSAIVSRIANAPILVKPEPRSTIQTLCPPI